MWRAGRLMLDRFGLRTAIATTGVAAAVAAAGAPAAAAAAAAVPAATSASPAVVGGSQLAGRGVIVNYAQVSGAKAGSAASVPRLPGVQAAAFVIADADTGQ